LNEEKNKKVCLVPISLGKGGVERSVALQSKLLHDAGYEVHLAILNDAIEYEFQGKLLNLGAYKSGSDSLFKRIKRLQKLKRYLKEQAIDLVIDHRSKNQYLRELFYKKFVYKDIKTIYVTHSAHRPMFLTEQPSAFVKICNSNVANVAVSKYIEQNLLKASGIKNTHTVYNTWEPDWERQLGTLPEVLTGKTYFLFYGRIDDSVKDLRFLLESFALSGLKDRGVYLVLMGEGPDTELLKKIAAELGIHGNILWFPFDRNPQAIISHARAVCLTSRYEGFPMVLVESLALGTPLVSLAIVSGPSEIVKHEHNGLLVSERDAKAFANALIELAENEKLYRTCKANAKSSVASFRPEVIGEQWKNLLQHV